LFIKQERKKTVVFLGFLTLKVLVKRKKEVHLLFIKRELTI